MLRIIKIYLCYGLLNFDQTYLMDDYQVAESRDTGRWRAERGRRRDTAGSRDITAPCEHLPSLCL